MKDGAEQLAAGILLTRIKDSEVQFLVLQARRHRSWSFPKGYVEKNEGLQDCASREFAEETGCRLSHPMIRMIEGKQYEISYEAWGRNKKVFLYLALWVDAQEEFPLQLSAEHRDWRWVNIKQFRHLEPEFRDLHNICESAASHVLAHGCCPKSQIADAVNPVGSL